MRVSEIIYRAVCKRKYDKNVSIIVIHPSTLYKLMNEEESMKYYNQNEGSYNFMGIRLITNGS
jgi:hypothetical protein